MPDLYDIGAEMFNAMNKTIRLAQAAGRITEVSQQVFLVTDPDLIAALRFYFEKELTFQGIDVLSTKQAKT